MLLLLSARFFHGLCIWIKLTLLSRGLSRPRGFNKNAVYRIQVDLRIVELKLGILRERRLWSIWQRWSWIQLGLRWLGLGFTWGERHFPPVSGRWRPPASAGFSGSCWSSSLATPPPMLPPRRWRSRRSASPPWNLLCCCRMKPCRQQPDWLIIDWIIDRWFFGTMENIGTRWRHVSPPPDYSHCGALYILSN